MRASKLRLVFAGTPAFAAMPLQQLITHGYRPQLVLTQPDRPAGRGRKMQQSAVKNVAVSHQIPVFQPESLKNEASVTAIREIQADLMIVVAYGLILPQSVLDLPHHGCWNIHASLLPRWRGAAPIQRAIQAGDQRTGVCIMQMDSGLDTGPLLRSRTTTIDPRTNSASLHDELAMLGAGALLECLDLLQRGNLPESQPQDHQQATYAAKITKQEARLDWNWPAERLARQVRAFNPWPVAWTECDGQRLRIWDARATDLHEPRAPGEMIRRGPDSLLVACAQGALELLELQAPGGRRLPVHDYLNAFPGTAICQ